MKTIRLVSTLLFVLLLSACGARTIATSKEDAQKVVDDMSYAKDSRTGLCYAVVTSAGYASVGITNVPCDQVKGQLQSQPQQSGEKKCFMY